MRWGGRTSNESSDDVAILTVRVDFVEESND